MSMADTRMEDADMSFSKEVLIRCCHQNSNPSLTITVKQKRNVARKLTTIYTESHNASTFFLSLQQKGIDSLVKITEEAVLSIFMSPDETLLRSCSYKKNIAAVLKACIPYHPETCHRILAFLPALRETRKNIQYLTSEEIQKVKEALANGENLLRSVIKLSGCLHFTQDCVAAILQE